MPLQRSNANPAQFLDPARAGEDALQGRLLTKGIIRLLQLGENNSRAKRLLRPLRTWLACTTPRLSSPLISARRSPADHAGFLSCAVRSRVRQPDRQGGVPCRRNASPIFGTVGPQVWGSPLTGPRAFISAEPNASARSLIRRRGCRRPVTSTASWPEYRYGRCSD